MPRKIYAILVAGGSGTRMGAETPKQFLLLNGRPILQMSIEKFIDACPGITVVVVLPKAHIQTWKELCFKNNFTVPQILVEGGITRYHSVKNALEKVPDNAVVMIHDGVRPMISTDLIRRMAGRMESARALIPVVSVCDTIKILDRASDGSLATAEDADPDRARLFAAQTPQCFLSEEIREAYTKGYSTSITDDASVARRHGIPLSYIEGERNNLKITTPEDYSLCSLLV